MPRLVGAVPSLMACETTAAVADTSRACATAQRFLLLPVSSRFGFPDVIKVCLLRRWERVHEQEAAEDCPFILQYLWVLAKGLDHGTVMSLVCPMRMDWIAR